MECMQKNGGSELATDIGKNGDIVKPSLVYNGKDTAAASVGLLSSSAEKRMMDSAGAADVDAAVACRDTVVDRGDGGGTDFTSYTTASTDSSLHKRETWTRKMDFLLACIGFSVGLGNVWRFPYLCYKNGGGAFLLPYFVCVVLGGIPMFFLEVAIGQYMSEGGIGAWKICPLMQGIGFATTIIVFLLNIYYNVILAWALRYLFASFTSVLPWSHCNNPWNTPSCVVRRADAILSVEGATNTTSDTYTNVTYMVPANKTTDPVTEYWERNVLQISTGIDDVGTLRWDLALCLLLAWILIYFCIWKGIKSSGKVMYFTATAPYVLMFILLIRGVTLPGAIDGIKFYVIPNWSKLMEHQVWVDAGTQIFFSYSISIGALTALGSYNKFHHNCWKDSVMFACTNSGTSFFAGFVIFSVLGFMANEQGVGVGEVAESGPGLAFIAYPKAVSQMPVSPLWSILFFLMVILLGLDSQFVGVEGFVTAVVDMYAHKLRKGYRKELFILAVCAVSFFIGLSMVTNGGMYVFQLFDYYSGSRIILLVAFFECITISYIYGIHRFYDNIEGMLGYRLNPYMQISWACTTPLFTLVMFCLCIYSYSELTYNRTYIYPPWAISIGWSMASCSVVMIPAVAIWKILTTRGSLKERLIKLIRPQLRPHQMRQEDDPKDLIDYCQTDTTPLDVTVIGSHVVKLGTDIPAEKESLTKLAADDNSSISKLQQQQQDHEYEPGAMNDDDEDDPPPADQVFTPTSPNKWGPKKG